MVTAASFVPCSLIQRVSINETKNNSAIEAESVTNEHDGCGNSSVRGDAQAESDSMTKEEFASASAIQDRSSRRPPSWPLPRDEITSTTLRFAPVLAKRHFNSQNPPGVLAIFRVTL